MENIKEEIKTLQNNYRRMCLNDVASNNDCEQIRKRFVELQKVVDFMEKYATGLDT